MIKAILFDFDGVIADTERQQCQALARVLAPLGIALDWESYCADHLGFDDRACFRHAFLKAGRPLPDVLLQELLQQKATAYDHLIRRSVELIPGVERFVREAAALYALAIVSGSLRREIDLVLDRSGLRGRFRLIVSAEEVSTSKPDPAGYLRALRGLSAQGDLAPSQCVVIEDSLPGLGAARAAGMRCVMVTTSHPPEALAGADAVWPSFERHHPDELQALTR